MKIIRAIPKICTVVEERSRISRELSNGHLPISRSGSDYHLQCHDRLCDARMTVQLWGNPIGCLIDEKAAFVRTVPRFFSLYTKHATVTNSAPVRMTRSRRWALCNMQDVTGRHDSSGNDLFTQSEE